MVKFDTDDNGTYETTISGAVIVSTMEELNGYEDVRFTIPNDATNRGYINTDVDFQILWDVTSVYEGVCTGGEYLPGNIECIGYNKVFELMQKKTHTGNYDGIAADVVLAAICASVPGVTDNFIAAGFPGGVAPTLYVRFDEANCFDAAIYVASSCIGDYYTTLGTTFNIIKARGAGPVVLSTFSVSRRGVDRAKKRDLVTVIGVDNAGNRIEGSFGAGTDKVVFREKKASNIATLQALAEDYHNQMNKESSGAKIVVPIEPTAYGLHPGDEVTINEAEYKLAGDYRIWKITKNIVTVGLEVDKSELSIDRVIDEMRNLEDIGIYIGSIAVVPKGAQNWNSNVAFSHGADSHDDVNWAAGTITFSDGTTQAIDVSAGVHTGLAVGSHYVYWTWGSTTLSVSATYSDGVGPDKGIIARLTVSAVAADSMTIEPIYSYGQTVGEGALGPEFDTPGIPAPWLVAAITATAAIQSDGSVHSIFTIVVPPATGSPTQYAVGYKKNGTAAYDVITSDSQTVVIEGLKAGQLYNLRCASISKLGAYSAWSATVNKTAAGDGVAPANPTNLAATSKNNGVLLEWDENTEDDLDHYEIWRDDGGYAIVAYVRTNYYLYSVISGELDVAYNYKIKAVDHTGNASGFSNIVAGTGVHVDAVDLAIEQRDWKSDISFIWDEAGRDTDEIWWGKQGAEKTTDATVRFSDGTSTGVNEGTEGALADGEYVYYWDEAHKSIVAPSIVEKYDLQRDTVANFDNAVGAGKGLVAIVVINEIPNDEPPVFITFNSYLPLISTGILAAYSVFSKNITSALIYGKDIATQLAVGEVAGNAGIRIIGDDADIIGVGIGDGIGGNFVSGIWGFAAGPARTFFFDPATGAIKIYGTGNLELLKSDGTSVGTIDMTTDGGRDVIKILTVGATKDIILESGGYSVKLRGDGDFDVLGATVVDIGTASSRLVLPQFNAADPDDGAGNPRAGEIWIRIDL